MRRLDAPPIFRSCGLSRWRVQVRTQFWFWLVCASIHHSHRLKQARADSHKGKLSRSAGCVDQRVVSISGLCRSAGHRYVAFPNRLPYVIYANRLGAGDSSTMKCGPSASSTFKFGVGRNRGQRSPEATVAIACPTIHNTSSPRALHATVRNQFPLTRRFCVSRS